MAIEKKIKQLPEHLRQQYEAHRAQQERILQHRYLLKAQIISREDLKQELAEYAASKPLGEALYSECAAQVLGYESWRIKNLLKDKKHLEFGLLHAGHVYFRPQEQSVAVPESVNVSVDAALAATRIEYTRSDEEFIERHGGKDCLGRMIMEAYLDRRGKEILATAARALDPVDNERGSKGYSWLSTALGSREASFHIGQEVYYLGGRPWDKLEWNVFDRNGGVAVTFSQHSIDQLFAAAIPLPKFTHNGAVLGFYDPQLLLQVNKGDWHPDQAAEPTDWYGKYGLR